MTNPWKAVNMMKRLISILFVLLVSALLYGCPRTVVASQKETPASAPAKTVSPAGSEAAIAGSGSGEASAHPEAALKNLASIPVLVAEPKASCVDGFVDVGPGHFYSATCLMPKDGPVFYVWVDASKDGFGHQCVARCPEQRAMPTAPAAPPSASAKLPAKK